MLRVREDRRGIALLHLHRPSTVLHGVCLFAQLRNCVPTKWSEGLLQRCGCRWTGSDDRRIDGLKKGEQNTGRDNIKK